MSGKQLSNGTLSLRFMQNAQRVKATKDNAQVVELERAEVLEDSQWEIPQNLREGWASTSGASSSSSSSSVQYESSYLPFLFSTSNSSSETQDQPSSLALKGRRSFAKGKEVVPEPAVSTSVTVPEDTVSSKPSREGRKLPRLKSLSGTTTTARASPQELASTKKKDKKKPPAAPAVSARDLIHQTVAPPSAGPEKSMFLKPAGVDVPASHKTNTQSSSPSSSAKRPRDTNNEAPTKVEPQKKRKKTKKNTVSGAALST